MSPPNKVPPAAARTTALPARLVVVDMARGMGILLMFVYHFSWDLTFFGFASLPLFTDPAWLAFRTLIVSVFLLVAGVSQVLAQRGGFRPRPFLRRLALIAACAGAITVATAMVFPQGFVFFGILHNLAVASVLVLPFAGLPSPVIAAIAAGFVAAPWFAAHPLFDHTWLQWIGLMTRPANSVDYVPLFPWFGVVLLGVIVGRQVVAGGAASVAGWNPPPGGVAYHGPAMVEPVQSAALPGPPAGVFRPLVRDLVGARTGCDGKLEASPGSARHRLDREAAATPRRGSLARRTDPFAGVRRQELAAAHEAHPQLAGARTLGDRLLPLCLDGDHHATPRIAARAGKSSSLNCSMMHHASSEKP